MIIIADSGSTKCDWIIYENENQQTRIQTLGLNPWHHSELFIEETVRNGLKSVENESIQQVFFYGSGSSTDDRKLMVKNALQKVFKTAKINVSHDLEASAIATCGNQEGLACILGTGSNICHWSGTKMIEHDSFFGLGYILGDEGSGFTLGKNLIKAFLYNNTPVDITQKLIQTGLNKEEIIDKVYAQKGANVYLASFSEFIYQNKENSFIKNLIHQTFSEFFQTHVLHFKNYQTIPCNFVGSIAYYFKDELMQVAEKYNVKVNTIIKQPIDNLLKYHLSQTTL